MQALEKKYDCRNAPEIYQDDRCSVTDKTKVAIVTASGRGIGAAIARELAADYRLVLMSRSREATQLAHELGGIGLTGSVTQPADLHRLVRAAMEAYNRIDAVVNNTGHAVKGDLLEVTDEDWHESVDLLLLNVVRMARLVTEQMVSQGAGAIVNISTFTAVEPTLRFPVSATLRAALSGFTKLYADRYAGVGVRMNNVLPGHLGNYQREDEERNQIPMRRPGTVTEVAKTVRFLLSPDASYITGQNIRVDGGLTRSL
jgi:NAD(P)-dependent dehydrogenase (short-subunit alcohol dehydrogenase family)